MLILLLTMIGRLFNATAWKILYIWCLEMFPTSYRITMLLASQTCGYIGGALGSILDDLVSWLVMIG